MADINQTNWSETDASNTTAAPDGMPEGMAPSGVNDWGRAVMGAVKRWFNRGIPKTTGGTTTAYTLTYTVAPAAYVDGETYLVLFNATNGAAPTLNINALGAVPIYTQNPTTGAWAAVATGVILANTVCRLSYNSSEGSFRIVAASVTAIGAAFLAVANAFTGNNTFAGTSTFSGTAAMSAAAFNEAVRVDVASAATPAIGAAAGNYIRITGTTTITAFDTVASGIRREVVFAGALTLTHNSTNLILPAGTSITTAAGDTAVFRSEGSGNWRCIGYFPASGAAIGIQQVYTETGAVATGTTIIPVDDTIPQSTEGDQYMSLAITPKSATSRLRIEVRFNYAHSTNDVVSVALFQDATANAIAATSNWIGSGGLLGAIDLTHEMTSGTTSATTFKVRAGPNSGGTTTFNGVSGGRIFGGVMASSITITEIP